MLCAKWALLQRPENADDSAAYSLSKWIERYSSGVKPLVVLGFYGATLDAASGPRRWDRWRPTVDLGRHEDLLIQRLELILQPEHGGAAQQLVQDLRSVSPDTEVRLHPLRINNPWDFEEVYAALLDFAGKYNFAPEREDYLVHITTGTHVAQICLFLLTESRRIPGRLLQASPPRRQGQGNVGSYSIIDLDLSRYDLLRRRFATEHAEGSSFLKAGIPTRNGAFNALIDRLEAVAMASRSPILLLGPTGAGKTHLARRLYELKKSRLQVEGAYVEVNCATLKGDQAMSTLFGHVKGSFTGAMKDRPGLLQTADQGLLFLDEIGDLGLDEQAMLLRALEEGRFLPLGADRAVESSFQLVAGTNVDLPQAVREGRFREDLLHRIDLWTFHLPALRARLEDLEPNLDYELERFESKHGRRVSFAPDARRLFLKFATGKDALWPGNFRELSGTVERLATLARHGSIDRRAVEEEILARRQAWQGRAASGDLLDRVLGEGKELDSFDRAQLAHVVEVVAESASLADAGRRLYAVSRQKKRSHNDTDRLKKYLTSMGLSFEVIHARKNS